MFLHRLQTDLLICGPDFIEREITQPTVCHLELLFQDNNNRILNFMKLLNILVFMSLVWAQDVLCSNKIEYYQNGNIEFCTLSSEDTLSGQPLPEGTGVHFTKEGVFNWCFLEQDTRIQEHLCRGGGHDFMTAFHPNGQLRTAWLAVDEVIQDTPCSKFRFLSAVFLGIHGKTGQTSFYENGQLRYCELSEKITIGGQSFKKKDAVIFNPDGKLIVKQ